MYVSGWFSRAVKYLAVVVLVLSCGTFPSGASAAAQEVPAPAVTRVVLYKHGMGYVERAGKVQGDAAITLYFRPEQMRDLLASFYVVDLSGGRITSIRYEAKDPLARLLQDIPVTVPEGAALSQFFTRLKGVRISVRSGGETVEGRVMGTEPVSEVVSGKEVRTGYRLVILTDAGAIRSTDLFGLSEASVKDESVRADLSRLLDLTVDGKRTSRKKMTVTAAGSGEREIRMGYLLEAPVWKASYRMILDPKDKGDAHIQGWAIAENTTEEDWKDVSLSFVAGSPYSFLMDLYTPLYVVRPSVPVPGLESLAVDWAQTTPPEVLSETRPASPPVLGRMEAGAYGGRKDKARENKMLSANVAQTMDADALSLAKQEASAEFNVPMTAGSGAAAAGAKVGEMFSYTVADKVSIPRGQAALLPIVSRAVKGKRVVYYKAVFSPKPSNAWVLQNDTDVTMEAGPVTFFEAGTSLGEGVLSHVLPPGSQEVVPYAADASLDVLPQVKGKRLPYFVGKVVDGILHVTLVEALETTWKLVNRGKDPATLWLNQPKNMAYKLGKPEKPLKEVDNHYRFEVVLAPGETRDFAVEERRDIVEMVDIGHADETRIRFFAAEKYMSPAVRSLLSDVSGLMAKKAALSRQIAGWKEQIAALSEEENRLRQNVRETGQNTPQEKELRAKWLSAIAAAEDKITGLRVKSDEASRSLRQVEEEMARRIREFKGE